MINKMLFKTNVMSDDIMDSLTSAFQTDRRIWALGWEKRNDGYMVTVEAEFDSAEMIAKFNSVGYNATLCT